MKVAIAIPGDGPWFEGHFPGQPILPGISELVLIARALSPHGDAGEVSAIPFVRFRGIVLPSETLDLTAETRGEGVRFEARRAGALVANGVLMFGTPSPETGGSSSVAARAARGAPSIDELIPHRPPMRFVERILGEADDGATCLGRISSECALVDGLRTSAFVALELCAQTAAVWEALRRSRSGEATFARLGYLVSLKDVIVHRGTIPAGAELIATVRQEAVALPLSTYAVDVVVEGERALHGTIGTYLSE